MAHCHLFDFDEKLKGLVKSINGCLFSSTYKCFYTDDTDENLKLILRTLRDYADIDINALTGKSEGAIRFLILQSEGEREASGRLLPSATRTKMRLKNFLIRKFRLRSAAAVRKYRLA